MVDAGSLPSVPCHQLVVCLYRAAVESKPAVPRPNELSSPLRKTREGNVCLVSPLGANEVRSSSRSCHSV